MVPEDVGEVQVGVSAPGGRVKRVAGLGDVALDLVDDAVAVGKFGEGLGGAVGAGGMLGEGGWEEGEGEEEEEGERGGDGEVHAPWKKWSVGYEPWAENKGRCQFLKEEKLAVGCNCCFSIKPATPAAPCFAN